MIILTAVATAAFAAVILFLRRGLYKLPSETEQKGAGDDGGDKFSIIVAARNEALNLPACLDSLLSQNIPADRYEVVAANDRSTDATPQILSDAAAKHPNLRVVTIKETPPGISPKKHAVITAIAASDPGNNIIVFTDADCVAPPTWLSSINNRFANGDSVDLVQGVTTYSNPPAGMNRLFWGLQSADFLSHGIIAAAAIAAGLPINANANNMAFRREVFESVGGYGGTENVVPGDDDQLLQRVWAYRKRVTFMTDPAGAVETGPTPTLAALFEQRRRSPSTTGRGK